MSRGVSAAPLLTAADERSEARLYRRDGSLSILQEHDSLDGEDVLPGFSCRLQAVLAV